ncbi:nuclear receptor 2C2-associated protein isoform X3 [Bactrocera neohumeralis]|uniref:nuclear receptor 2C2-associated protein isoform X3 n=1 Tax=Bactrocera neohumeralis TaxID=98809 RepID=UPI00216535D7|nr:nuclear receptor 2C2-associated protein isoform X3 [Bactrocera neohumeralis]
MKFIVVASESPYTESLKLITQKNILGTPQWIIIRFEEPQAVSKFSFQFQGGFVAKTLLIHVETEDGKQILEEAFYPEDINSIQTFILNRPIKNKEAAKIKFLFPSSTDFFGRIILYELEIFE